MIDVNRRIAQWDQSHILSAIDNTGGKTQIVGGQRTSTKIGREASMVAEADAPRASAVPGTAEPGKAPTEGATALTAPDQGQGQQLP